VKLKYFDMSGANFVFWHLGAYLIYAGPYMYRAIVDGSIGLVWGIIYAFLYNKGTKNKKNVKESE